MNRAIKLSGIDNLRDFGGYATACGRGLRPGRLYRSAHHHGATDADLEALAGLRLAVIVDLRRAEERARQPSRRHPGFAGQVIENDIGDADGGWEAMLRDQEPTAELFQRESLAWYRGCAFEPRHVDLYARYFAALAETDGPVLIHCAAGKDRTGLLAALTHHVAGVHPDDMLADYLMTNHLDFHEVRAPSVAAMIATHSGRAPSDEAVRAAMSVEARYLETALEAIVARYGSIDAYLDRALGFDSARRAAFESRLLG